MTSDHKYIIKKLKNKIAELKIQNYTLEQALKSVQFKIDHALKHRYGKR
jgi:hypothetical protein